MTKVIEKIDRASTKKISESINSAVKKVAEDFGLILAGCRGSFCTERNDIKVSITLAVPAKEKECNDKHRIQLGLCVRGDKVRFYNGEVAVIEEARRTRYVFHFEKQADRKLTADFRAFKPFQE